MFPPAPEVASGTSVPPSGPQAKSSLSSMRLLRSHLVVVVNRVPDYRLRRHSGSVLLATFGVTSFIPPQGGTGQARKIGHCTGAILRYPRHISIKNRRVSSGPFTRRTHP